MARARNAGGLPAHLSTARGGGMRPRQWGIRPRRPAAASALLLGLLLLAAGAVRAQTDLGGQRIGTSSGTFLKIGLDARVAGLGGVASCMVEGPASVFSNPAGLLYHRADTEAWFGYVNWPAGLDVTGIALSRRFGPLGGQIAAGFQYLGTSFEETTEFYPLGTGRDVTYSDLAATISFARFVTDRLGFGLSAKYFREDLGWNLGGPLIQSWLFDAGTSYAVGYRNARLAITLANFGPDLRPEGSFTSRAGRGEVRYTGFSPPTQFQLGMSIDPWSSGPHRLTVAGQILHQSDEQEGFRTGMEYWLFDRYALRAGYDNSADEMSLSAGLGFRLDLGGMPGGVDYAYTEGGHLAAVHRWSVRIGL